MLTVEQLNTWVKQGASRELRHQLSARKHQIREIFQYNTSAKEVESELSKVELILHEIRLILVEIEKYGD